MDPIIYRWSPYFVATCKLPCEGAHAGQAKPAQGNVHGDPHVRGAAASVGALFHPQLARGSRGKVSRSTQQTMLSFYRLVVRHFLLCIIIQPPPPRYICWGGVKL